MARMARRDQWPEYSTYTAGFLLKENLSEDKKGEYVYTKGDSDVISFHIYASWFSPPSSG